MEKTFANNICNKARVTDIEFFMLFESSSDNMKNSQKLRVRKKFNCSKWKKIFEETHHKIIHMDGQEAPEQMLNFISHWVNEN